jgi:hypothetical protein
MVDLGFDEEWKGTEVFCPRLAKPTVIHQNISLKQFDAQQSF